MKTQSAVLQFTTNIDNEILCGAKFQNFSIISVQ